MSHQALDPEEDERHVEQSLQNLKQEPPQSDSQTEQESIHTCLPLRFCHCSLHSTSVTLVNQHRCTDFLNFLSLFSFLSFFHKSHISL